MNEVKDTDKVRVLERLLTAIVGRQEAKVEYRMGGGCIDQVIVECDPDNLMRIKSFLDTADLLFDFYITEKEVPEADRSSLFPKPYEGICEVTFYLEEQYWKSNLDLKEQLKTKENEIAELKKTIDLMNSPPSIPIKKEKTKQNKNNKTGL